MQWSLIRFALLVTSTTMAAHAQDAPPASAAPHPPCAGANYRAFDFWIGAWDVTQNGQPAGVNRIEAIDGGCALLERWTSAGGNFTGHSLNSFNRIDGRWHQTWVDSDGTLLKLTGGRQDGADGAPGMGPMVLQGEAPDPEGVPRANRITWTSRADGTVRQHWEVHDGEAWNTLFDGEYRRRIETE
jgi:hypothetical protein